MEGAGGATTGPEEEEESANLTSLWEVRGTPESDTAKAERRWMQNQLKSKTPPLPPNLEKEVEALKERWYNNPSQDMFVQSAMNTLEVSNDPSLSAQLSQMMTQDPKSN